VSTTTDSTSQRIVYSIFTRSREYSNAIHCTPLLSWRTTSGVVAGMGPGAALELEPWGGLARGLLLAMPWLLVAEGGGFSICCCGRGCWEVSIFMIGLADMAVVGTWGD
jgi:hypothetical protein